MRQWKLGALTLGALLIILGILIISFRATGLAIIDKILIWWPLVLIMLGLEILGYNFFSKSEHPKMKFDGFSIFAIILLILFCISSFVLTSISDHIKFEDIDLMRNSNSFKHEFTLNKSITTTPSDKNTTIIEDINKYL
jgi:hypothetical protein